jgi:hypothetical protein
LEGDSNTKYFQLITNGKLRKTQNFQLQHDDRIIEGDHELKKYITSYYKDLLGQPTPSSFLLVESRVDALVQVFEESNDLLKNPFTMDEV